MERNDIDSSLTDKELIEKAYWWIDQLIKSGGKEFVMHVPARLDHDTDLVLFNLAKRFENLLTKHDGLQAKCESYENERHETRLALRMLLKVFSKTEMSTEQSKFYLQADYILDKYHHVDDVLRNGALPSEEGEKEDLNPVNWNDYLRNQKEDQQ